MIAYRADWVLTLTGPPLRDGAVTVEDGRVDAVGPASEALRGVPDGAVREQGRAVLLPGLVNAHTHLSLTGLEAPPGDYFRWLGTVARAASTLGAEEIEAATRRGWEECRRLGTAVVGEITTRPEGIAALLADPRVLARVYVEFLGLGAERARGRFEASVERAEALARGPEAFRIRPGLSPHAPYSVRPELWPETAARCRERNWRWSSHVAEPPGEDRFLRRGDGPVRDYLESLGVWDDGFPWPGAGGVEMLAGAGVLDGRALLVHGVHLEPAAMDAVAAAGAHLCLCPRSNAFLGLPPPPVRELAARGVRLCVGTDSRAGNDDLSVWAELRRLREIEPGIPAEALVRMATAGGARALGFEDAAGAIAPGYPARLIAVSTGSGALRDPHAALVAEPVEDRVTVLGA